MSGRSGAKIASVRVCFSPAGAPHALSKEVTSRAGRRRVVNMSRGSCTEATGTKPARPHTA